MLIHMQTKNRLYLIMILTQIGFAILSSVAILSDYKFTAIITTNIFLGMVMLYINYYTIKRKWRNGRFNRYY